MKQYHKQYNNNHDSNKNNNNNSRKILKRITIENQSLPTVSLPTTTVIYIKHNASNLDNSDVILITYMSTTFFVYIVYILWYFYHVKK